LTGSRITLEPVFIGNILIILFQIDLDMRVRADHPLRKRLKQSTSILFAIKLPTGAAQTATHLTFVILLFVV